MDSVGLLEEAWSCISGPTTWDSMLACWISVNFCCCGGKLSDGEVSAG